MTAVYIIQSCYKCQSVDNMVKITLKEDILWTMPNGDRKLFQKGKTDVPEGLAKALGWTDPNEKQEPEKPLEPPKQELPSKVSEVIESSSVSLPKQGELDRTIEISYPIDINTATVPILMALPGIQEGAARAIIDGRPKEGYKMLDEVKLEVRRYRSIDWQSIEKNKLAEVKPLNS